VPIASAHPNVTVFQSSLPIDATQCLFKAYLAGKCVAGGWCVDADIDEFFDYPFSDLLGLAEFLRYLNSNQYTAVVTQLLDMLPEKPLSYLEEKEQEDDLSGTYGYYDTSNVRGVPYERAPLTRAYGYANKASNGDAQLLFGGIRRKLYGNDCLLTKHSLFVAGRGLDLFPHAHFVNGARLADVSCVMRHYKFTSCALRTALQNRAGFIGTSRGYDAFIDFLRDKPEYQITQSSAERFGKTQDLVRSGFLFMSGNYREYVKAHANGVQTEQLGQERQPVSDRAGECNL
jgi:hypothetical protein